MFSAWDKAKGFTIIEVMIVLASSGTLLLVALLMIGGQVNKANFLQGQRSIQLDFQNLINQVTSGSFIFPGDISCSANATGAITVSSSPSIQGHNVGCIFIGKAIYATAQFSPKSYSIYNVVGQQCFGALNPCTGPINLYQSAPVLITQPNDVSKQTLEGGMTIKSIYVPNSSPSILLKGNNYCGIGILATSKTGSGGLQYGLYVVGQGGIGISSLPPCDLNKPISSTTRTPSDTDLNTDSFTLDSHLVDSIDICLQSGGSTRNLVLTTGSSAYSGSGVQGNGLITYLGSAGC